MPHTHHSQGNASMAETAWVFFARIGLFDVSLLRDGGSWRLMTFWVRGTQVSGEQRFNQQTSERFSKYMVRLLVQAWVETLQQFSILFC